MKFMPRLVRRPGTERDEARASPGAQYESVLAVDSRAAPGARFVIHRMSFGRRMELSRRVRELSRKAEFLTAGAGIDEKIEANILALEIDAMYLRWGLVSVEGMTIDGELASFEQLLEKGPEALVREIVTAIKAECGLNEEERKN
jgi:hypothetical protein